MILDIKILKFRELSYFLLNLMKIIEFIFEVFLSKLDYPEFKIEYIQENESISNFEECIFKKVIIRSLS